MNGDHSPDRGRDVLLGASLTAVCGLFAWGGFALLTMMMNPALAGADYWSAVRERAESNPILAGAVVVFGLVAVVGVALVALAVVRRQGVK